MEEESPSDVQSGRSVHEYLGMLRRHKWLIAAISSALILATLAIALALPPVYRSTATILVQEQEVPPDLVRSTITSFADERIQVISQQVMTRASLLKLVEKYDLYAEDRGRVPDELIVERMRRDIRLSTINADVSDRSSGRRVNATIAFTLSYDAPDRERAQQVVNALVSLYLNENVKARQQSVAETSAFLAQEAERVGKQVQDIESRLAEFKRRNVGRLPESSSVNVQLADRTEGELQRVEREISLLHDRKLSLEAQLSLMRPSVATPLPAGGAPGPERVSPAEERLRALQAQYSAASAIYGPDHPDVRRLQRELSALRGEAGSAGTDTAEQRRKLEAELAALKERYGDDHPDVQRLRRTVAGLDAPESKAPPAVKPPARSPPADPAQRPDNPAYILLTAQLQGTQRELVQLAALKEDLRAKQRTYDARLQQIPEVEREYRELTRDYGNAQTHYQQIKTKQMQAEGALELEKDLKAERFGLGEPANLPQRPFSPNRPRIMLLGILMSLGSGLGAAFLRELFDSSVKSPDQLARLTPVPILTAIPYIGTQREHVGNRRKAAVAGASVLLLLAVFTLGVHAYLKPLPALLESVKSNLRAW